MQLISVLTSSTMVRTNWLSLVALVVLSLSLVHPGDANSLLAPLSGLLQKASQSVMSHFMGTTQPSYDQDYKGGGGTAIADRVASLVSNSLGGVQHDQDQTQQQQQQQQPTGGLFGGFMRLLGLDSSRIGAIAINAFVFISEMITATLAGATPFRPTAKMGAEDIPRGSPMSWILENPGAQMAEALTLARDHDLPELLIRLLHGRSRRSVGQGGPTTWCLQRLACQLSPILWGMQQAVSSSIDAGAEGKDIPEEEEEPQEPLAALWKYLPSRDQLRDQGKKCEVRFPQCELPKF